jgi:hypothetical protein
MVATRKVQPRMRWPGVTCVFVHHHSAMPRERWLMPLTCGCSGATLWLVLVTICHPARGTNQDWPGKQSITVKRQNCHDHSGAF